MVDISIVDGGYKLAYNCGVPHCDTHQWEIQDPIDGGTVPYFWPYFAGIFPEI